MIATRRHCRQNQMLKVQEHKLAKLMVKYMDEIGATLVRAFTWDDSDAGKVSYEYEVLTPHGMLRIHFADPDHHLHCRFEDVGRACRKFNPARRLDGEMNPFSGKYNAYAFGRMKGQDAFEQIFKPHLQRALEPSLSPR